MSIPNAMPHAMPNAMRPAYATHFGTDAHEKCPVPTRPVPEQITDQPGPTRSLLAEDSHFELPDLCQLNARARETQEPAA